MAFMCIRRHRSGNIFPAVPLRVSMVWNTSAADRQPIGLGQAAMVTLTGGLLARCREKIFLALSDLGAAGFEQRGTLLRAFQKVLQHQDGQ